MTAQYHDLTLSIVAGTKLTKIGILNPDIVKYQLAMGENILR